jgi:arylsulfatase A-like enzyme
MAEGPRRSRLLMGWLRSFLVAAWPRLRRMGRAWWTVLLCSIPVCGCGGAESSSSQPRLVILYATCTVNKSYLFPYNESVRYTPALQKFAGQAVTFQRHQTESGQSGIAYASIFSGTQAPHHGVYRHPTRLSDEIHLITEAYAEGGYDVHTWLRHPMANAELNYAQGVPPQNVHQGKIGARDPAFQAILDRLERHPSYKAFIVTNFTVTHGPYTGALIDDFCRRYPGECRLRPQSADFRKYAELYRNNHLLFSLAFDQAVRELELSERQIDKIRTVAETLYKSDVFLLDHLFGLVVNSVRKHGLLDDSLIVFTADHGEVLYRDNAELRWTHGFQLAPEVLGVPFILFGPGSGVKPATYDGVTRSIDVFPTMAGLSNLALPDLEPRGVDLSAALRDREPAPEIVAFSHTALLSERLWQEYRNYARLTRLFPRATPDIMWVGARSGDEFYLLRRSHDDDWEPALFDLANDPGETRNLFDPGLPQHREMLEALQAYKGLLLESFEHTDSLEHEAELLKELGYIE